MSSAGLFTFFVPLVALGIVTAGGALFYPTMREIIFFTFGYFAVPVVGAFGFPTAAAALHVSPVGLAAFAVFASGCGTAFLAYNFDWLRCIPSLSRWIARVETVAAAWSRHRWLRICEFLGLILFVALPITGASGPAGVVLGRLLGMSPSRTFAAVWLGSSVQILVIIGCIFGTVRFA